MTKKEFAGVYDKYADAIFRHCYFRVYDRELAQDLMQETFKKVWIYTINGNEIENVKAFLYRTANNLVIDHKRKKHPISLDTLKEKGFEPKGQDDEHLYTNIEAKRIVELVKRLDGKYRQVILLRFVEELSPKEIAEVIGRSQNVVSVRLNRAIRKVRDLVEESRN